MRYKQNAKMTAVLAASEARARGIRPPAPAASPATPSATTVPPPAAGATPPLQQRLIGIDTALRKTGWGIIDCDGNHFTAVDCGAIVNPSSAPLSACLRKLHLGLLQLLEKYHPDLAVIEGGFYCKNVHTAMILGAARGTAICQLAERGLPVYEYAPRRVKEIVCGYGHASKGQVAVMVSQFLRIQTENLSHDSTDALALTLCHAQLAGVAQGLGLPDPL